MTESGSTTLGVVGPCWADGIFTTSDRQKGDKVVSAGDTLVLCLLGKMEQKIYVKTKKIRY